MIKTALVAVLLVLAGVLAYYTYFLYLDASSNSISFIQNFSFRNKNNFEETLNITSYVKGIQFYPNMRYATSQISYNFDNSCQEEKKTRVLQSFERLTKETGILVFSEEIEQEKADILIICNESEKKAVDEKYYILGEGGPIKVINASKFYIIEKGEVQFFYKNSKCNSYNVELHELLHSFGFDHSINEKSIMYDTTSCDQKLTQDIIDELIRLYSISSLSDLTFGNVSASKYSRYLNFKIEVKNIGLKVSEDWKLEVYYGDGKIKTFNSEKIGYGEGKFLTVENLKIPTTKNEQVKFIIIAGEELNLDNNIVELYLE